MAGFMSEDELRAFLNDSDYEEVLEDVEDVPILGNTSSSDDDWDYDDADEDEQDPLSKKAKNEKLHWKGTPFVPIIHKFDDSHSGISPESGLNEDSNELDFFYCFFTEDIMKIIVSETNDYANKLHKSVDSGLKHWTETNVNEMYVFIASIILMGVIGKRSFKKYWTANPVLETPFFRELFSQNRFFILLRCLHFSNNDIDIETSDKLQKIRNILDPFKKNLKTTFYPFQNLRIDERLFLWKRKLSFKIHIPTRRYCLEMKLFICSDVTTGYVLDIMVYVNDSDIDMNNALEVPGSVVATILKDYLNKGHTLFVDQWYSSLILFNHLNDNKTNACGLVRPNKKGMPLFDKLQSGEIESFHAGNIMALKWHDRTDIHMLTTMHENNTTVTEKINYKTGEFKIKPAAVVDYLKNTESVRKVDRTLCFSEISRKSLKWYKKIFFRMIDIATINSFFLYKTKVKNDISFYDYRENLIKQIVQKHEFSIRLTAVHYPKPVPQSETAQKRARRQCHVCKNTKLRPGKRQETSYMCKECGVALCVAPCFKDYHTKKIF